MQNIVATFDDPNSARLAMARLQESGIAPARIRYNPSPDTEFLRHAGPSQPRPGEPGYHHQGFLESIGGFFANLIESHTDESGIYAQALHRGTTLVLVQAESGELAHVLSLLQDYGALSLEDRVSQWRCEGWRGGSSPGAAATAASPARADSASVRDTMRGGPVGTHSFTGGGAGVGMPATGEVGGAGARPHGRDMADTGTDPTLPSGQSLPTEAEIRSLDERAVASDRAGEPSREGPGRAR